VTKIIGTITWYRGTERSYLRGRPVEIVAVFKNALVRDEPHLVSTDEEIEASGGITTLDRVVVAVVALGDGRDRAGGTVRATDLDCFRNLLRARGTT
jgi:hypothetical protein